MGSPTTTPKVNVPLILTILGFFLGGGILFKVWDWYKEQQEPTFTISAINALTGSNVYEITNYLIWYPNIPTSALNLNLGLEVRPTYYGESLGEVQVLVKNTAGEVVARNSWKSLNKDSEPLQIVFNYDVLDSLVDAQEVPYREDQGNYVYPTAELLIEVSKVSDLGHPLHTDTIKVLNTPWYHFSRAIPNFLYEDAQTLEVFIKGRNLGDPSEFILLAEVYEITDPAGRPFDPWPKRDWGIVEIGNVERNAEFSARVAFPNNRFRFEPGKCYAIKTFAIKKQNYVEFQGVGWKESDEVWRFGDWEDFALVCFRIENSLPMETSISSTFDADTDNWRVINNDGEEVSFYSNGGNSGGYISVEDNKEGTPWYWSAPDKFLGDKSAFYGGKLSFDLRQSVTDAPGDLTIDIILVGQDMTLQLDMPFQPEQSWKMFSVRLDESENWVIESSSEMATISDLKRVLQSIVELRILGDYQVGKSVADLDNVILEP